jgi:hypothetical protein
VAAAVTAGVANWLHLRSATGDRPVPGRSAGNDEGHTIYVDPWAGTADEGSAGPRAPASPGPSSLP